MRYTYARASVQIQSNSSQTQRKCIYRLIFFILSFISQRVRQANVSCLIKFFVAYVS